MCETSDMLLHPPEDQKKPSLGVFYKKRNKSCLNRIFMV